MSKKKAKEIKIEIGKANIHIPVNEIALISKIIKELSKSCYRVLKLKVNLY